jgi:glycosyltransferase involved in cell wall biosynthesis
VVPARLVRSLDHVTVMSVSQRAYFTNLIPEERVTVIHHGVDTTFFTPRPSARDAGPFRCLTAGSYLRDWTLLRAIAQAFAERQDIHFHVVSADAPFRGPRKHLRAPPYQRRRAPHPLSIGGPSRPAAPTPRRTTRCSRAWRADSGRRQRSPGGQRIRAAQAAVLVPPKADAFVEAIAQLVDDAPKQGNMAQAARAGAESFAWRWWRAATGTSTPGGRLPERHFIK